MKKLLLIFILLFLPLNVNAALEFDNDSVQYLNADEDASLDLNTTASVFAWVYVTEDLSSRGIISKGDTNLGTFAYKLAVQLSGNFGALLSDDGTLDAGNGKYWITTSNTMSLNTWHHIGFTFNAGTLIMYLDSSPIDAGDINKIYDAGIVAVNNSARPLFIGAFESGGATSYLHAYTGKIGDARIYNIVLSLEEIQTVYHSKGSDNITNGLVGRWLMNEKPDGETATVASSVIDVSVESNHGSPVNSPIYRASALKTKKLIIHH